jgi:hypothetical protein
VQRRRHGADAELSRGTWIVAGMAVGALLVGACSDSDSSSDSTTTEGVSTSSSVPTTTEADESALDLTALPLGDDRYTDAPEVGYVYTCQTDAPAQAPPGRSRRSAARGCVWVIEDSSAPPRTL